MKKQKTAISEKVINVLGLPKEGLGAAAAINIIGREEISVEGYKGILEYTENIVRLNTDKFIIKITGADLSIGIVAEEYINIKGLISGVEYDGYNKAD